MWQIGHAPPLAVAMGISFPISSDRSAIADVSLAIAVLWLIYGELRTNYQKLSISLKFDSILSLKNTDSQQQLNFSDEVVFFPLSRRYVTLDLIGRSYWRSD